MLKLLLEGVYNHGEVMWLETMWSLRRLFLRSFVYSCVFNRSQPIWVALDGWVEVMPEAKLIRFCDYRGSTTWRYDTVGTWIIKYRNGDGGRHNGEALSDEATAAVKEANNALFYKHFEALLDPQDVPVEHSAASEESKP